MRDRTLRVGRVGACVVLSGATALVLLLQPQLRGQRTPAGGPPPQIADLVKPGFKFSGASTCAGAKCHGAPKPTEGAGATTLAEYTQWNKDDPHRKAYSMLEDDLSIEIAEKLKIEDPLTDVRCTSCHGLPVEQKLQGKGFDLTEGVTCGSCHGASEKWDPPHRTKGWTQGQRVALKTHDALLAKWGLYDTKNPLARADKCTSCHLAIDADMVAAGHPQPVFELDYYSRSEANGGLYVGQHWRDDPKNPFYSVSLWATGQAVALRDAMTQLAQRAGAKTPNAKAVDEAYRQAMAHYNAFKPVVTTKAVAGDLKAWDAAAAKMAADLKAKKFADIAAGAKTVAAGAAKLAPTVGAAKFDRAKTLALLKAVLADTKTATTVGRRGMEQQAYAVYSLHSVYNPKGEDTTNLIFDNLFADDKGVPPTADKFTKGLAAIAKTIK